MANGLTGQLAQGVDPFAGFLNVQAGQQRGQQLQQQQQRIGQEGERLDLLRQQETRQAQRQRFNNILKVGESVNLIDPSGVSARNFVTNNLSTLLEASGANQFGVKIDPQKAAENGAAFLKDSRELLNIGLSLQDKPDASKKQLIDKISAFESKFGTGALSPVIKQIKEAQAILPKEKKVKEFEAEDIAERVSRELFGKSFANLNQTQQATVNKRLREERIEEKRQEGFLAEESRLRKGLSGESAGKLALLTQATKDVNEVKGFLFDEQGNLNVTAQAAGFFNLPIAQGRQISSRIQNAVAAKLRAETGAAANAEEIKNIAKRFEPVPGFDDAAATLDKLNRLEEFLSTGAFFIDPTGQLRQRSLEEFRQQNLQTGQSRELTVEDKVDAFFQ